MSDCENFEISDYDREFIMNPLARRNYMSKAQATYGVFLADDSSSDESEMKYSRKNKKFSRDADYQKPINFVSGGIKGGTHEKDADSLDEDLTQVDIISDDSDDMRQNRKRSGDDNNKKSFINKKPKSDVKNALSGFASWEKNTKGFGTKMMQKMGYEPGKGLGPSGKGIITPIEAVQRKQGKGSVGYYGAENISKPLTADEIKKSTKIINESNNAKSGKGLYKNNNKFVKTEYKTYDQILNESKLDLKKVSKRVLDVDSVTFKEKIIDMSTSEVKEYTGYQHLYKQRLGEENGSFGFHKSHAASWQERHLAAHKEIGFSANSLMKNLDTIINDTTDQLAISKIILNKHTESKTVLNSEIEKLDKIKQMESDEYLEIENVLNFFNKFEEKMCSYDPNNVNDFVSWINEARMKCKKYPQVIIAIGRPLLNAVTCNWRPFEKPFQGIEFFITCQEVLDQFVFESLFRVTWLPILKKAIQYEWNPHKPTPLIELLDGWRPHIPEIMLKELLQNVIVVKLTAAVDSWNPCQDTVPIHSWLHPWILYLSDSLKPIYETVRYKLGICLNTWHASDDSAHAILLPWRTVFAPQNMSAFLKKYIEPKLTSILRQIKIDPSRQDLEQWNWVMKWSDLLSPQCMEDMLMKDFFPRWMQVLTSWLNQANISRSMDAYQEIGLWYKGWMSQMPIEINELPSIKSIKKEALRLMTNSRKGQHTQYNDQRQLIGQEEMLNIALGNDNKRPPATMRERLETYAQQNGICFYPLAQKFYQDRQVYWFGERHQICFDRNYIYILNHTQWDSISFNELVCRS